ncbi:MAG: methyltransferase domain-containing protein [Aquificae bacterium]|nr:methyltransferase domain-containing protein [Aquificota bacterium]
MNPFDAYASRYDAWYEKPFGKSAYELELKCIKSMTEPFGRALEVGVGSGRFAGALGIRYGVDPSLSMLQIAKKRGILVVQGKGESLPFLNASFDAVFIIVSICFVDDPIGVFYETRRVLKEGGNLYLGLILKESVWARFYEEKARSGHPIYKHARFFSFFELTSMLRGLFSLEEMRSTLIEEPQDKREVKNKEIRLGFLEKAGFTCLKLRKKG